MTTDPPGPEGDLPGMIRRHPNGALYARRELPPPRARVQEAPWIAITLTPSRIGAFMFDEEMAGTSRIAVMPGTTAAFAAAADLSVTVNDREAAVDHIARALFSNWSTDYAYQAKPWEELRPEHQRAFRRRARAVLPVLDRWHAIGQQLAAAAAELGGDRG